MRKLNDLREGSDVISFLFGAGKVISSDFGFSIKTQDFQALRFRTAPPAPLPFFKRPLSNLKKVQP